MSKGASALELLSENPILRLGAPASLERLARASVVKEYRPNAVVAIATTRQTHVLVLASGKIALRRKNREARTQVLVGSISAPAIFGDAEAYAPANRWLVSVRAVEPTVAVAVPNGAYDAFVEAEGRVAAALYRDACARHYLSVEVMQVHALQKTQHKIPRLLWRAGTGPAGGPREAPLRQSELGGWRGSPRRPSPCSRRARPSPCCPPPSGRC